ncbi:MAG: PEGA domain-containing protein [Lachnospiraceae bacterium]|nr:PEGA domain-containing protein [Lachnospiraceae bacterium]
MKRKTKVMCLMILFGILLMGCQKEVEEELTTAEQTSGFVPAKAGTYDSADTAVVFAKDTVDKTITFFNLVKERYYTLAYDGTSKLSDKYGTSISMKQVQEGDIVDITFLKSKKKLNSLQMSADAWKIDDVSRFEIKERQKEMKIAGDVYNFTENIQIFSNNREAQIMDINRSDLLNVQGIGHTVYSICVDKGHGYLRLKNDEYFLDGWIEVGQALIQKISEDMLLVVPEGTYEVLVSANGISGSKKVTIERDKETELDIGDLKGEEVTKYGNLIFSLSPDFTTLYLDGEEVDTSAPVQAEYGIHQMIAKADGYQTITQYIRVGQENATIQVTLEKESEKSSESSNNSVSSNSTTVSSNDPVSTSGYKVTIDAPSGVEVYVDGKYVGISPISFTKVEGVHVVTLRKTGYATRSYTIEVDGTNKDANYSFSDLTTEEN